MTVEEKWVNRFKKLIKDMPKTLEVGVCSGIIDIYSNGSVKKCLDDQGDSDDIISYSEFHDIILNTSFYGNEERN